MFSRVFPFIPIRLTERETEEHGGPPCMQHLPSVGTVMYNALPLGVKTIRYNIIVDNDFKNIPPLFVILEYYRKTDLRFLLFFGFNMKSAVTSI